MKRMIGLVAIAAMVIAACGGDGGLTVADARLTQPVEGRGALYFTVMNAGPADQLIGISSQISPMVELHQTQVDANNVMQMSAIAQLDVPEGESVVLEPGGLHVMVMNATDVDVGDTVTFTLAFANAGDVVVEAPVVAPGAGAMNMGDDG